MIAIAEPLHATRLCGIAAYGAAAVSCILSWWGARRAGASLRLALALAAVDTVLLLDMVFNWRWELHQLFVDRATRAHVYGQRHGPQEAALMVLLGIFVAVCGQALRRLRGRTGAVLAVWGTIFAVSLWLVEVISLHRMDHIVYRNVGPLLPIGFFWIAACLMTSTGILLEAREVAARNDGSSGAP